VFFQVDRVHHEVVHVDNKPSFSKVVGEDMVHKRLKRRRRVALAKEHYGRFVEPVRSSESSLPLVGLLDSNIIVSPSNIKFREIMAVFESIDEIGDTRKGVSVLNHVRVDILIVLAGTEHSIFLRDKEKRGRLQGF